MNASLIRAFVIGIPGALPITAAASSGWFYEPPTPLSEYHERIPTKTGKDLLDEFMPRAADAALLAEVSWGLQNIVNSIAHPPLARDEIIKAIEALLERNRSGDYRKRYANALWDLRDLLANGDAGDDEINRYAQWRIQQVDADDGFFARAPFRSWDMKDADYASVVQKWKEDNITARREIIDELGKTTEALRPHWQVQLGSIAFKQRDFEEAIKQFDAVTTDAKAGPRAEVAQLMLGRCHMEVWRGKMNEEPRDRNDAKTHAIYMSANAAFDAYLKLWPKGRFAADVPGWKAGMARLRGDWRGFISLIAAQLDDRGHPEVMRRALQEFERGLNEMARSNITSSNEYDESDLPWHEIAARPVLAMRMLGFMLDAHATDDTRTRQYHSGEIYTNGYVTGSYQEPIMRLREAGKKWLPRLAEAVNRRRTANADGPWRQRQLLTLAWASSEGGLQTQAVRLIDGMTQPNDDVLFARAVILSRSRRPAEAAAACATLLHDFPDSPYAEEARFRLAVALKDSGDWTGSLLALDELHEPHEFAEEVLKSGERPAQLRLDGEIKDWRETILHFAPLKQLATLLSDTRTSNNLWSDLMKVVRRRSLALDDFDAALAAAAIKRAEGNAGWGSGERYWDHWNFDAELPEQKWLETVTKLSQLKLQAAQATQPAAKARLLMSQAELWDQQRGHLTRALIDEYPRVVAGQPGCVKLRNAIFIGIPEAEAGDTIDRRDELHHAMKLWLQAADLVPGTATAAEALERANEALRRMAEFHDTNFQRAYETNATALSRQIHDRLKRDHAASDEAQRAVWWTFPALGEVPRLPNNDRCSDHEDEIAHAMCQAPILQEPARYYRDDYPQRTQEAEAAKKTKRKMTGVWQTLRTQAATEPAEDLVSILKQQRTDITQIRMPFAEYTASLNDADDLIAFFQTPGIPPEERSLYVNARLDHGFVPEELPAADSPAASFFAFLRMIRAPFTTPLVESERALFEKNGEPKEDARALPLALRMEDFLKRFPKGPKREAALTRLAVNTVRDSLVRCSIGNLEWPQSPWMGRYVHPMIQHGEPLDEAKVFGVLDQYEHEFPAGRYLAEIRLARSLVCLDTGRWEDAVRLLTVILEDPTKPDLHRQASLRLAYAFMALLEPENRMAVITAVRKVPASRRYLDRFTHSNTCGARLLLMQEWLVSVLQS